jgi:hypothetical protein
VDAGFGCGVGTNSAQRSARPISSIAGASILGTGGAGFAAAAVTSAVAGALAAIVVPTAERSA